MREEKHVAAQQEGDKLVKASLSRKHTTPPGWPIWSW